MSNIIATDDVFLIISMFLLFLSFCILVVTYIYNKKYIKKYRNDFIELFFGKVNGEVFIKSGGDLVIFTYGFLPYYSNYKMFSSMKVMFPSKNDKLLKPLPIMPNCYRENLEFFECNHKVWITFNLWSLCIAIIFFSISVIYILYLMYVEGG